VINMRDDAPSMYELEELGRKPLSTHFFMRDFLYSESASLARIVNYPDDPKIALKNGRKLCELLLAPSTGNLRPDRNSLRLPVFGSE
jgi:hypothetical protein